MSSANEGEATVDLSLLVACLAVPDGALNSNARGIQGRMLGGAIGKPVRLLVDSVQGNLDVLHTPSEDILQPPSGRSQLELSCHLS